MQVVLKGLTICGTLSFEPKNISGDQKDLLQMHQVWYIAPLFQYWELSSFKNSKNYGWGQCDHETRLKVFKLSINLTMARLWTL